MKVLACKIGDRVMRVGQQIGDDWNPLQGKDRRIQSIEILENAVVVIAYMDGEREYLLNYPISVLATQVGKDNKDGAEGV